MRKRFAQRLILAKTTVTQWFWHFRDASFRGAGVVAHGQKVSIILLAVLSTGYDVTGNAITQTDALSHVTQWGYDG